MSNDFDSEMDPEDFTGKSDIDNGDKIDNGDQTDVDTKDVYDDDVNDVAIKYSDFNDDIDSSESKNIKFNPVLEMEKSYEGMGISLEDLDVLDENVGEIIDEDIPTNDSIADEVSTNVDGVHVDIDGDVDLSINQQTPEITNNDGTSVDDEIDPSSAEGIILRTYKHFTNGRFLSKEDQEEIEAEMEENDENSNSNDDNNNEDPSDDSDYDDDEDPSDDSDYNDDEDSAGVKVLLTTDEGNTITVTPENNSINVSTEELKIL